MSIIGQILYGSGQHFPDQSVPVFMSEKYSLSKPRVRIDLHVAFNRPSPCAYSYGGSFSLYCFRSPELNTQVKRQYLNLFPSVFLTRKVGENHQFRYGFSRRIDRPNYADLNPFIYVMDSYTYRQGDPFLQPQYTQAFEVGYTYKNETNVTLSFNRTYDVISHINEQKGELLRVGPANLNRLDNYNLTAGFPLKPTRW